MPAIQLLIKGKVQGVFYRASAQEKARGLGLTGRIRNTPEGHVEAMATGPEEALQAFTAWCRQGPAGAKVKEVTVTDLAPLEFDDFRILH